MQPDVGTRPPEQGRRARHVAVMRERLIEVSLDLYDRRGFGATTIDQIAADAEVHRSTFFRYFENKEAVLFAPLARSHQWFVDALGEQPAGEPLISNVVAVCTRGAWPSVDRARLQQVRRIIDADPLLQMSAGPQLSSAFAPVIMERLRAMNPEAGATEITLVSSLAITWSNAAFSKLIEHGGSLRAHFAEVIAATRRVALDIPDPPVPARPD